MTEPLPVGPDELLVAVADGDQGAFAALYDELAPVVYGSVRRIVRDPSLAEDVAQEVFVQVWRQAPRYDPSYARAKTWVLTIAHRRAVDRVRNEQSSRDRVRREGERASAPPAQPDELTVARLDRDRVLEALTALSPIQRESIELAYFGGHTYPEVAALLDVPLGTVKTRIRDGLRRLRDALETR